MNYKKLLVDFLGAKNRADEKGTSATGEVAKTVGTNLVLKVVSWKVIFWIAVAFFVLIILFFFVLMLVGLFNSGDSTSASTAYLSGVYENCQSITVEGQVYSLEDYVTGVVSKEAYTSEGIEALKAQAVAARTYVIYNSNNCSNSVGNSTSFQTFNPNFNENAKAAVEATAGEVLTYNGNLFSTQYDSFCYADKDCPDAVKNSDGSYTVTYTRQPNNETHKITLSDSAYYGMIVSGQGHAHGMSQLLSYQLAKEGKTYDEILRYFYSDGIEIASILVGGDPGSEGTDGGKYYDSTFTASNGKTYKNFKQLLCDSSEMVKQGCGITSFTILASANVSDITPDAMFVKYGYFLGSIANYGGLNGQIAGGGKVLGSVPEMKEELINKLGSGGTAVFFVKHGCIQASNGKDYAGTQHFFAVLDYDAEKDMLYISNPSAYMGDPRTGWTPFSQFEKSCVGVRALYD